MLQYCECFFPEIIQEDKAYKLHSVSHFTAQEGRHGLGDTKQGTCNVDPSFNVFLLRGKKRKKRMLLAGLVILYRGYTLTSTQLEPPPPPKPFAIGSDSTHFILYKDQSVFLASINSLTNKYCDDN